MALLHVLSNDLPLARPMVVQKIECSSSGWCDVSLCLLDRCSPPPDDSSRPIDVMVGTLLCTRKRERMDHARLLPAFPGCPSSRLLERANATTTLAARDMASIWHLCVSPCFRFGLYARWGVLERALDCGGIERGPYAHS